MGTDPASNNPTDEPHPPPPVPPAGGELRSGNAAGNTRGQPLGGSLATWGLSQVGVPELGKLLITPFPRLFNGLPKWRRWA